MEVKQERWRYWQGRVVLGGRWFGQNGFDPGNIKRVVGLGVGPG